MSDTLARDYADSVAGELRALGASMTGESLGDWLDSVLDYRYTYSSARELVAVEALVAFGGPNCWVHFEGLTARVDVYWGGDHSTVTVHCPELVDVILEGTGELVA